ncbi:hypothetical protein DERF_010353 [Dermatophagoides farinae]|uniref:Uncharacterized protein n=1 Tax=Dermatophagoides farinae TaxID=6954 RepID=A0A922L4X6_DERFA|nr:hypothetical protein DERF_010353 [Dermatophagoides farinae]
MVNPSKITSQSHIQTQTHDSANRKSSLRKKKYENITNFSLNWSNELIRMVSFWFLWHTFSLSLYVN